MAPPPPRRAALLHAALLLLLVAAGSAPGATATGVFQVYRKFPVGVGGGTAGANLSALRAHDGNRHGRLLAAADLPLGGLGLPTDTGYVPVLVGLFIWGGFPGGCLIWFWVGVGVRSLYFTQIKLGTPPKGYYVQVDTGSDILWVNCITCERCPHKSGIGVPFPTFRPLPPFCVSQLQIVIQLCSFFYVNAVWACS